MQKIPLFFLVFPCLICAFLLAPLTGIASPDTTSPEQLHLALSETMRKIQPPLAEPDVNQTIKKPATINDWLNAIYDTAKLQPIWVTTTGPGKKAEILLAALQNSSNDGLVPEHYQVSRITSLWQSKAPDKLIELDTLLTTALVLYGHDAQYGRADSGKNNPALRAKNEDALAFNGLTLTQTALSSPDFNQFLTSLFPPHKYYKNLRAALPHYQALDAAGGWPSVASGKSIHPGEQEARIPAIRTRLQGEGFLQSTASDSPVYDEPLVQAVTSFQRRHGLTDDGVIGQNTIAAMNIPAHHKVRQIILNLERWRWEAHDLGQKYILVDIAGFTLEGIADNTVILEMPVVVGALHHETPIFSDQIEYMDLNPYWNIPVKIARDEMLDELKKNPNYLNAKHIRLFSDRTSEASEINPGSLNWKQVSPQKMGQFKLRQDPGKWNALGAIKFIFPNSFSVYMHDTPAQSLFKRSNRAFSHGCIRLGSPLKLAEFLMGGAEKGWPPERFKGIIDTGTRTIIRLPEPLPVHITYQTVKSDQDGTIFFYPDIYNRDQQLEKLLFKEEIEDARNIQPSP